MATKPLFVIAVGAAVFLIGDSMRRYIRTKFDIVIDWHALLRPSRLTYTISNAGPYGIWVTVGGFQIFCVPHQYTYGLDIYSRDDAVMCERFGIRLHPRRIAWLDVLLTNLEPEYADPDHGTYRFVPRPQ